MMIVRRLCDKCALETGILWAATFKKELNGVVRDNRHDIGSENKDIKIELCNVCKDEVMSYLNS